ncbi:Rv3235 family protein, partial [Gordonia sp. (in: high G+C Gram-positive bacteria)]|uniref:Rv3235 family protein n=1 Tax=Gordonia sp. (in: high G+C Gram-positive bacteria) TaxID=84139 RepID=UPI0039E3826C
RARPPVPAPPPDRAAIVAREFAIAAMTVILEVLDRRRPVTALKALVQPPVVDHVITRGRARYEAKLAARHPEPGPRLRRVHIQLTAAGQAEFFGSYACGPRVRAFAGRMAVPKGTRGRRSAPWRIERLMLD